MKLNNKGFTLVELLAVIVILLAISMVAIPNITASLEKNKNRLSESQKKIIVSSAELFISENKNSLGYYSNFMNGACCLSTDTLKDNKNKYNYKDFMQNKCGIATDWLVSNNYLSSDDLIDGDNKTIIGCVMYNNGNYSFIDERTNDCIHC